MPLRQKYRSTFISTTNQAVFNLAPSRTDKFNFGSGIWTRMGATDPAIDVTDAESIYIQADLTNSTGSSGSSRASTSININIHASWGTTANFRSSTELSWTSSGEPYTSFNLATPDASATNNNTIDGQSISVAPSFLRIRVDSSSSGGVGSAGLEVITDIRLLQT